MLPYSPKVKTKRKEKKAKSNIVFFSTLNKNTPRCEIYHQRHVAAHDCGDPNVLGPPLLTSVCSLEEMIERPIWQTVSAIQSLEFPLFGSDSTGSPGYTAYRLSPEPAAPSVLYLPHLEAYKGFYYERGGMMVIPIQILK